MKDFRTIFNRLVSFRTFLSLFTIYLVGTIRLSFSSEKTCTISPLAHLYEVLIVIPARPWRSQ